MNKFQNFTLEQLDAELVKLKQEQKILLSEMVQFDPDRIERVNQINSDIKMINFLKGNV